MRSRLEKTITALLFLSPFLVIGQSSKRPETKPYEVSIEPSATFLNLSPLDITRVYKQGRLVETYYASDSPSFFHSVKKTPLELVIFYISKPRESMTTIESQRISFLQAIIS